MNKVRLGFGGGCHWCTEAVFKSLKGVDLVEQGFIRSEPPHDVASEAVQIQFDPAFISMAVLIEIHLRTHASTSDHTFRKKYRSAVYTTDTVHNHEANDTIAVLGIEFDRPIVTKVMPLVEFIASPEHYQNYYANHSNGEFCQRFIDPKLALLRRQFRDLVDDDINVSLR